MAERLTISTDTTTVKDAALFDLKVDGLSLGLFKIYDDKGRIETDADLDRLKVSPGTITLHQLHQDRTKKR